MDIERLTRIAMEHAGVSATADMTRTVSAAVAAAVEAFSDGVPTQDTALDLMESAVMAGLSLVPVDLPPSTRAGIRLGLRSALHWLWRELQPVIEVDAGDADLDVEVH
jgi:hypothetical protein